MKNKEILEKLTLEEKVGLCSGKDAWFLKGVMRADLPSIMITDGPHGLRKKAPAGEKTGLLGSVPATCFPTAATTACSWDPELIYKMGQALAEECLEEKVSVLLGPGVNMKRSPLCGRNFEYFSEDPLLAGEIAAAFINGVQSKNVGTSLKHFAVNSQEKKRMTINEVVDERALREIYLTAFEIAVKKAQPWTIMNAYNRVNGEKCADSAYLQNTILRDEWGFEGVVVSDWGAVNDRVKGIKNGNDLEMPSSDGYNDAKICKAVREGRLEEKYVDIAADRMITLIKKSKDALCEYEYNKNAHHLLAAKVCEQSLVLLKNENKALPLSKDKTVAVIGEMARAPRYQGAGSSLINPTKITDAFDGLISEGYRVNFAPGYSKKEDRLDEMTLQDARTVAAAADTVVMFIGLTEDYESEGYDRKHINLPEAHNILVEEILKVNENVIVVLSGGAPVVMPWLSKVKAVINGYLGGQASGRAIARIISGAVNPSGKLAETYPLSLEETPSYNYYPGLDLSAEHRESIYIGYRYYDTAKKDVLFPFGYGLSYTEFEYSDLKLSKKKIKDSDTLTLSFRIRNTGDCDGAEIAQIYVRDKESTIFRPEKELRAFKKVFLKKGEEKEVTLEISKRAFAYYNINLADWHVESGEFEILVASSSRDVRLSADVFVESTVEADVPDYKEAAPAYYTADVQNVSDKEFEAVLGCKIPESTVTANKRITVENALYDARETKWGKVICGTVLKAIDTFCDKTDPTTEMLKAMALEIPINNFVTMSSGVFTEKMCDGLLMILNGEKPGMGVAKIIAGLVSSVRKIPSLLKNY